MSIFKKILYLLSATELRNASFLLVMMIFMAIFDMIGVASILPFMAVLTNPNLIETNIFLNNLFEFLKLFGVYNYEQFLFILGILVFVLLIFSLAFKTLTFYFQVNFIQFRGYTIGRRLIEGYLNQPYSWFLSQHSVDFEKTILSEVDQIVDYGISSLLELIAKLLVTIALIFLIIIVDPKMTLIVGLSLSLSYLIIFLFVRNYLSRSGEERLLNNKLRFKTVSEVFSAIKEVKFRGLEKIYVRNFKVSAKIFASTQALAMVISQIPKFFLEAIAFGGILLIILILMAQKGNFYEAIPLISLYAFVGYRLMPALQSIYVCFTNLSFIEPSLNKLTNDIKSLEPIKNYSHNNILTFKEKISLKGISFNYPNSQRSSINNLSLTIPAKSTIGLVGLTGSGKTTIIDIILGLLLPQSGLLEVDGITINEDNVKSWQQIIGYVPQHIYLSDDTIAANIAFGVKPENIDLNLVYKVSKIACLHNFVMDELSLNYQTKIGERGVRLSGGQRQRIGIARALYNSPSLLILDEATSALDDHTEEEVMNSIYALKNNITIISIAHRLRTLKNFNKIFLISNGAVKDQGSFDELKERQNFFRR